MEEALRRVCGSASQEELYVPHVVIGTLSKDPQSLISPEDTLVGGTKKNLK